MGLAPTKTCRGDGKNPQRGEKQNAVPVWHLFNGPIDDAISHVGQITSFRRSAGNPINPFVNVFMGKTKE